MGGLRSDHPPDAPFYCENGAPIEIVAGNRPPGTSFLRRSNPPGQSGDLAATPTIQASPSLTTIYTVTVTEFSGCTSSATETVTFLAAKG